MTPALPGVHPIAGYLTYVHYAGLHPVCAISHGCETVRRGEGALLAGYALTLVAFAFSLYLTYREIFTIHAICSWCVSSAIVLTLLAIVGTVRVLRFDPAGSVVAAAYV